MKFKFGLVTLLMVGLLAIFPVSNSAMAAITVTTSANDAVSQVAAGDSVVVAAFSVTAGAAADAITSIGAKKNAASIATTDLTAVSLYEDVNMNGAYDVGVDIFIGRDQNADLTSGPTDWNGGAGKTFTYTYTFASTGDTKYYIVLASVEPIGSTATALDGKNIATQYAVNGTWSSGGANPAVPASDVVNVKATKLVFDSDFKDQIAANVAGSNLLTAGTGTISAVDDYGNIDATIGGTLAFDALYLANGSDTGTNPVAAGAGIGAAAAAVSGVWTAAAATDLKYGSASTEDVVLVATESVTGIKGTFAFRNGAAIDASAVLSARGIEFYDTNHNGYLDHCTIFFNGAVKYMAGNIACKADGTTAVPVSAFSVKDGAYTYTITGNALVKQFNGGVGINNAGAYGVTLSLTERGGGNYDTGVVPQVNYNSAVGGLVGTTGTVIGNIVDVTAKEVDKASPILLAKKTVDDGVATGTANNGYVDGIQLIFSEQVAAFTTQNTGATGAFTFNGTMQDGTPNSVSFGSGNVINTRTVTLPINETIPNTGILPILVYTIGRITDSSVNATSSPDPNSFYANFNDYLTTQSINIKDGVSPIITNLTTLDTGAGDGKIDRVEVTFSENMNANKLYAYDGVSFWASQAAFGSDGADAGTEVDTAHIYSVTGVNTIVADKITFNVTPSGNTYDTEVLPYFRYTGAATLYDANGFPLAAYSEPAGSGRVMDSSVIKDGAAPVMVTVETGDRFTEASGAGLFSGEYPDGIIETMKVTFSEKVTTQAYAVALTDAAKNTAVDAIIALYAATYPGPVAKTFRTIASFAAGETYAKPTFDNTPDSSGDTSAILTLVFDQATTAQITAAAGSGTKNGGDTVITPTIDYTKVGGAGTNDLKDTNDGIYLVDVVAGPSIDKAKPVLMAASTGDMADASTPGDGDGYIDNFILSFSETVKIPTATNVAGLTITSATPYTNTFTLLGFDSDAGTTEFDTTPDINLPVATPANTEDNNVYFAFGGANSGKVILYATNSLAGSGSGYDTASTPSITNDGTCAIVDANSNTLNALDAAHKVTTTDTARPVIVQAIGSVSNNTITAIFSEDIILPAGAGIVDSNVLFGYTDVNTGANADATKGGNVVTALAATAVTEPTAGQVLITTTGNLSIDDVEKDLIWIKTNGVNLITDASVATNAVKYEDYSTANGFRGNAGVGDTKSIRVIIDDPIAPWITSAKTIDADGNGLVDHIRFTFSEPIKLASVGTLNTMSADVSSSWRISGYTGTAKFNLFEDNNTGKAAANVAGKPVFVAGENFVTSGYKTLYLEIEEGGVPVSVTGLGSTGFTPTVTFTAGVISDNKPNTLETTTAHFSGAVIDTAPPIAMKAEYTSNQILKITFSEDLDTSAFDRTDINWTMSNVGANYHNNVVNITEPTPGVLQYRTNEVFSWDNDFAGTVAITNAANTIKDLDVDGTGTDIAEIAIASGLDAYPSATWYNSATPPAPVASPGNIAASLTIQINIAGVTIAAPAALVTTDKPGDNGHYFYANFTPSSTTTVTSYLFFAWDANEATSTANDSTWVNFAAASVIPTTSGKVTYLVPTPYTGTMQYAVVASTGTAFSLLKATDGEIGIAELVETAAAKTADVQFSDFSCTAVGQATDNIPPAAFTIASASDVAGTGTGIEVTWNALGQVGTYGSTVQLPIYGADYYEIYRAVKGTTTYTKVGQTSDPTTSTFIDMVADGSTVYNYYVRAIDGFVLANPTTNVITGTKAAIASIGGADYNSDNVVGYTDFILFASYFNTTSTDAGFVSNYDLNADGKVDNDDFILFAVAFNETASKVAKIAEMPSSSVSLNMNAEFDAASSVYYVTVNLSETAVDGFQLNMSYDTNRMEYIQNSITGLGDLSIIKTDENGILVNAAFINGEEFGGTVTLAFRSKDSNTEANFELVNALVTVDDVTGTIGKLASASVKATPTVYGLAQNYPNPFNPTTTIDYTIPTAGSVELIVYNMSGQKVRTLVNEVQSPAFYKVVWDGKNDRGESVASGLYFYKLVSGSFSKTAKMNLVK